MTPELFDQLARDAIGEARDAAATEGYFSAAIDITVDRTPHPAAVTLQVVEGEPTRIASVDIGLDGPATENAAGIEAIAEIRRQWLLPQGAIFRQRLWDSAKERAVATLAASPFASAHLASSEAAIDPDARRADLKVAIDSGPPFFFGGLAITGLSNYDLSLVRNFSTLTRGEPYSLRSVQEYVRRLTNTGYFASVQAAIDPDPATAAEATVKVGVIEAPPKRIEAGIGYSTDTQFRANLTYRDVNIDGHALRFSAEARYESLAQVGSLRFDWPPDDTRWANAVLAQVERTDLNDLITKTATIGFRRTSIEERNQWQFGIGGIYDQQFPLGASEVISHALYIDAQRAWRRTDDLLSPTRGRCGHSRRVEPWLRTGGRARAGVAAARRFQRADGASRRWRGHRQHAYRGAVHAAVSNRRRDQRARLQIRQPGRTGRTGHGAGPLLRRGKRRGDALDQRLLGPRHVHRCGQRSGLAR